LTAFGKYENIDKLTREILIELIDHIKVYEGGDISISNGNCCNRTLPYERLRWLNSVRYWLMLKNGLPTSICWCKKSMRTMPLESYPMRVISNCRRSMSRSSRRLHSWRQSWSVKLKPKPLIW